MGQQRVMAPTRVVSIAVSVNEDWGFEDEHMKMPAWYRGFSFN
jgi:hypothetical protein